MHPRNYATTVDEDLHVQVDMEVELDLGTGRFDAETADVKRFPGAPPMAEVFRRLARARLVEEAVRMTVNDAVYVRVDAGAEAELPGDVLVASYKGGRWARLGTGRVPGEDDHTYTARLYRIGALAGARPSQFVQHVLGLAPSTVRQRLTVCRRLGLLPPTTHGKVTV